MDISYQLFEIGILLANNGFTCPVKSSKDYWYALVQLALRWQTMNYFKKYLTGVTILKKLTMSFVPAVEAYRIARK